MEDLEQYSRKNNLIISRVPKIKDEEVKEVVKTVASGLKVMLLDADIDTVHRLPSKDDVGRIIVKLVSRDKKIEMATASKRIRLNRATFNWIPNQPMYCDDQLTNENKRLLMMAKRLKKDGHFRFVWIRNCNVIVRVNEADKAIQVKDEEHLCRIIGEDKDVDKEQTGNNNSRMMEVSQHGGTKRKTDA